MSKKIYVGNLPFSVTLERLKEIFAPYGDIEDAIVMANKFTGKSRGFGFVTFANEADADKALAEMNNKNIEGRELKVKEARPLEERPREEPRAEEKPKEELKAEEVEEPKEIAENTPQ
jgi:RNA recognition motif-containing protein